MQNYRQCLEKSKLLFLSDELICISSKSDSQKESWRLYYIPIYKKYMYVHHPDQFIHYKVLVIVHIICFLIMIEYGNGVLSW